MPFRIVRNDITKMNTEAIVNTANDHPAVGTGCDHDDTIQVENPIDVISN